MIRAKKILDELFHCTSGYVMFRSVQIATPGGATTPFPHPHLCLSHRQLPVGSGHPQYSTANGMGHRRWNLAVAVAPLSCSPKVAMPPPPRRNLIWEEARDSPLIHVLSRPSRTAAEPESRRGRAGWLAAEWRVAAPASSEEGGERSCVVALACRRPVRRQTDGQGVGGAAAFVGC